MAWITAIQADAFLGDNPDWEAFTNKDELLQLASNRLEQLTFKDEPVHRVEARYLDGNSLSKVADTADFLLDPQRGNWDYQETLGWIRSRIEMNLIIFDDQVAFDVPDINNKNYSFTRALTFKEIQSLHTFGGLFEGHIALDLANGHLGSFSIIDSNNAFGIVDEFGEQVFLTGNKRRLNARFGHNDVYAELLDFEGTRGVVFDGVSTVDVIDEQGDEQTNVVPLIAPEEYFTYKFKIVDGLDKTMFLYVNDILVGNPTFNATASGVTSSLVYQSGSGSGVDRHTYVRLFGATINVENPVTIPIRLVGACALLANEYGKFPPNFVGDKEYLENENDYNRMQDLPINVQAAVEPFLADYESVVVDGIATTTMRGEEAVDPTPTIPTKMTDLEYN